MVGRRWEGSRKVLGRLWGARAANAVARRLLQRSHRHACARVHAIGRHLRCSKGRVTHSFSAVYS